MTMKSILLLTFTLLLFSCHKETTEEIDLSPYFKGINGSAVFYNPATQLYKIHNPSLSSKQSSPCSTFKIMSAYMALSENIITQKNSNIEWSGKDYENPAWNQNMNIKEAFKTSCVWYFRTLINQIPQQTVKNYLQKYHYGNQNISDWYGHQNTNTDIAEFKGFWIESSLQISPLEQVKFLEKLFSEENQATRTLKNIMLVKDGAVKIYGKTGLGIKNDLVDTAWFVGFYEQNNHKIFFAVRLHDKTNSIKDYRHLASFYAKQIALDIIQNANVF